VLPLSREVAGTAAAAASVPARGEDGSATELERGEGEGEAMSASVMRFVALCVVVHAAQCFISSASWHPMFACPAVTCKEWIANDSSGRDLCRSNVCSVNGSFNTSYVS